MKYKHLLGLVPIVLLAGCFTKTVIEYVPVKDYIVINEYEIRNCPIAPPPDREEYVKSSCEQRNVLWTNQYHDSTQATYLRNVDLKHTREQQNVYRSMKDKKL